VFIGDIKRGDEGIQRQGQDAAGRKRNLRIRDVPVLQKPDEEPLAEILRILDIHPDLMKPALPGLIKHPSTDHLIDPQRLRLLQ